MEQVFQDWLTDSPNDPDLWHAKARVNSVLGDRSSFEDIAKAIELSDENIDPEIYLLRARTKRMLNVREDVISDLTTLLDHGENIDELTRMHAAHLLAWELGLQGELQHGGHNALELAESHVAWLDQLQHAERDLPMSHNQAVKSLGLALLRSDKPTAAQQLLQSIAPSNTVLFSEANSGVEFLLAMCEVENGNRDKALEHFENELSTKAVRVDMSAAAAIDWLKLKSVAEESLALEPKPNASKPLRWSPMELIAQSRWNHGIVQVQYFPQSRRFIDPSSSQEFKSTKEPVTNLYWNTNQAEGEIIFELNAQAAGKYDGQIVLTHSFNYGMFEFELNGKPVGQRFDGRSDVVIFGDFVDFADVELRKGVNQLKIRSVGKSRDSKGFYLGVESLEFTPN